MGYRKIFATFPPHFRVNLNLCKNSDPGGGRGSMTKIRTPDPKGATERRMHKSDPTPPSKRDKAKLTPQDKETDVVFTDWASI